MSSNVPGQFLGYTLQFPRALCRLLQCGPGGSVGIEVLGDVSAYFPDGTMISEEDKSSINSNPLTDRSTNLWKTFFNWVTAVNKNEINVDLTFFVLYCNQSGQKALVDEFHLASSFETVRNAIEKTKEELKDINSDHEIWKFYNYVINEHQEVFAKIIQRFELQIGIDASYDEVCYEFKRLVIPDGYIDFAINEIGGWFQRIILERIIRREPAIVSFEEYCSHSSVLYTKIRQRALIDFASQNLPKDNDINDHIKVKPTYIKQLDLIKLPDNEKVEAVSDYLRADFNRGKWIEEEILDEENAIDFEEKLKTFWKNKRRQTEILNKYLSEEDKGQILLSDCQSNKESIGDRAPPDRTIQGTYHALADKKDVGWHPSWEQLIEEDGGE